MGARVAVAGASGYVGGELLRLLAGHPDVEIVAATGHTRAGTPLAAVHPQLALDLTLSATEPATLTGADLVFLALPHGESAALAAALPAATKVVDLGSDHRAHDAWVYGLPELPGRRAALAAAVRVANTGCYAVATILALAPLIAAGLADPDDVVVVAASGTSGAGATAGAVREALAYAGEPFVRLLPDGVWPSTAATLGANSAHLQSTMDSDSGRIIVTCAIDNLGKGAAGQAVQCANLMLGLRETAGLTAHGVAP